MTIYGELGRLPYECVRYRNTIRYWSKLIQVGENENKHNYKDVSII